jgi:hypothetical protein
MKHYFIVNPAAGKGKDPEALIERIKKACREKATDFEIPQNRTRLFVVGFRGDLKVSPKDMEIKTKELKTEKTLKPNFITLI